MLHKVYLRGYNSSSPFKSFYLCDPEGLAELSEAYAALLALPISEDNKESILEWTVSPAKARYDKELNEYESYWGLSDEEREEKKAKREERKISLRDECDKVRLNAEEILSYSDTLVIPFMLGEDNSLRYFVNPKSPIGKKARKLESEIEKYSGNLDWGGSWYSSLLEGSKKQILQGNSWAKNAKVIVKGNLKKHPCMQCTRAMESIDGVCGFGGNNCQDSLGEAIFSLLSSEEIK